jgi:hypothetical protein
LTRRFRGLLCSHMKTTARDGFAVQSGLRHERPTMHCTELPPSVVVLMVLVYRTLHSLAAAVSGGSR